MPSGSRCSRIALSPAVVLAALLCVFPVLSSGAGGAPLVAVLDIDLLKPDNFPEPYGVTADERQRLEMVATLLRERLAAEGFGVVPGDATHAAIVAADPRQNLYECNGCERDIAADLGADWVMVGWIQIVSNLIINLNVLVLDQATGAPVAKAFVDLRGNNERSWRRATTYLLDNTLVPRLEAARAALP